MAAQAILVVVVVCDPGLRSALAARLSLDGFELLTASGIGYGLLGSTMIRPPAVLVIDEALIPGDAARWIEKQRNVAEWYRLAVITSAAQVTDDAWCHRIAPRSAHQAISDLLSRCANDESRDR